MLKRNARACYLFVLPAMLLLCGTASARSYIVTDWNNCIEIKQPVAAPNNDYCVWVAPGTYATGDALCAAIHTAFVNQFDGNAWCAYNPAAAPSGFSLSWAHALEPAGSHGFLARSGKNRRFGIWSLLSIGDTADYLDQGNYLSAVSNLPVIPFGSIDTPAPNATVSGTINVQGWVLAQRPASVSSPGVLTLYVDGVARGVASYGGSRPDVTAAYPDYVNSAGAAFGIAFDTRTLVNGQHTLAISATDDLGRTAGIGSRYFTTLN
jgi:hypothetical protein